jgi:hypothetical protein
MTFLGRICHSYTEEEDPDVWNTIAIPWNSLGMGVGRWVEVAFERDWKASSRSHDSAFQGTTTEIIQVGLERHMFSRPPSRGSTRDLCFSHGNLFPYFRISF